MSMSSRVSLNCGFSTVGGVRSCVKVAPCDSFGQLAAVGAGRVQPWWLPAVKCRRAPQRKSEGLNCVLGGHWYAKWGNQLSSGFTRTSLALCICIKGCSTFVSSFFVPLLLSFLRVCPDAAVMMVVVPTAFPCMNRRAALQYGSCFSSVDPIRSKQGQVAQLLEHRAL